MIGRIYKQLIIKPKDCVLYVNKPDPFGNMYQGIPDTYVVYDQLKWMANIERGFATAMDARGISMIHVAIKDFELEDRAIWQKAYGNPSTYNVMFTDKDTEVKNIPGIAASFDLNMTNDAMTKEVASGTGYAMSRIDGTQRGQVTGTQTDTDNYYSMISTMQEEFENENIELHEKLRPDLEGNWDISWEVVQKMDKQRKAEIFATEVNSAQVSLDFLTYNQILERFGYDPVPGGDITASVYIHAMYVKNSMAGDYDEESEDDTPPGEEGGSKSKESKSTSAIGGSRKQQAKMPNKNDDERANKKKGTDAGAHTQCKMNLDSGRQCLNNTNNTNGLCHVHEGSKKKVNSDSKIIIQKAKIKVKKRIAEQMKRSGDSHRVINEYLTEVFGDAFGFGDLVEIGDKVLRESRAKDKTDTYDAREIDELNVAELILMLGYDSNHPISQLIGLLCNDNMKKDNKRTNKEIIKEAHVKYSNIQKN